MSIRIRHSAPAFLHLATIMLAAMPALAGSWQPNAPFGAKLQGDLYTPTTPAASPAILVSIHFCGGNSGSAQGWFKSYADQYGFYIIAPNAGKNCFDSSLSRDSNSDPGAIVKMVQYLITNKNADPSRVFAAGLSSGGCMTNTLLAIFPDVFAGGAAMPGFPAGLWPAGDTQCTKCGSSPGGADTGQAFADKAKSAFSFSGTRPCSQQWVGGADQYNFDGWLPVVASQFQILGNLGAESAGTGAPTGWTRKVYKDTSGNVRLETNVNPSTAHDLGSSNLWSSVISFLGLDKPTGACGITTGAGGASSTGGASSVATGGTKAAGGATSAAGGTTSATGGTKAAGGTTSAAGGATSAAGGATSAAGGTSAAAGGSGTKAAGGASAAGGTKAAGGASAAGGTKAAGGASAAGGTKAATGGAVGNSGGASAAGGNGATNTTAVADTGGSSTAATTNQATAGGSGNAGEGGNAAVGGNEAVGGASVIGSTPGTSTDAGGCGCRVAGNDHRSGTLWGLGLLGAAFAAWRRRQPKVG